MFEQFFNAPVFDTLFWAEFYSKLVLIGFLCVGGALFINKSYKAEISSQKYFSLGLTLFAYLYALTRFFFIITDFMAETQPDYLIFWRLATISSFSAILFLELVIEKYLVKSYYVFSALALTGLILVTILDLSIARIISYSLSLVLMLNIVGIYIYVARNAEGDVRKKSIQSFIGILVLAVGAVVDGAFLKSLVGFDTGLFGAIIIMFGMAIFFRANYKSEA